MPQRKPRNMEKPGLLGEKTVCLDIRCTHQGEIHERCASHSKVAGFASGAKVKPCGQWPMVGMTRCRRHAGAAGSAKSDARILAATVTYGNPLEISPHAALLEELYRTNGHVAWLANKISEMSDEDLVWGTASTLKRPAKTAGGADDDEGREVSEIKKEAALSQWLALYQSERAHLAKVAETCIRANIQERQIAVIEAQAVVLAQVIQLVITDERLGIDAPPKVQSAVVRDAMNRMELLGAAA